MAGEMARKCDTKKNSERRKENPPNSCNVTIASRSGGPQVDSRVQTGLGRVSLLTRVALRQTSKPMAAEKLLGGVTNRLWLCYCDLAMRKGMSGPDAEARLVYAQKRAGPRQKNSTGHVNKMPCFRVC